MSGRYQQIGPQDEALASDVDQVFLGVEMRLSPDKLKQGQVASAKNLTFRNGIAEPRSGFVTKPWGRQLGTDFNIDFPFSFDQPTGFGKVWGACTFADPNGQESQILACSDFSWEISANTVPSAIPYPAGVSVTAPVSFTQAFQVLIMWRGEDNNPIKLDTALDFPDTNRVWREVEDETNPDYTSTIPDAANGICYGNRIWVPFGDSQIAYSDILAYTRYDASLSTIFINEGESDLLMCLAAFGSNALVAFKNHSVYYITSPLPNPATAGRVDVASTQRGLVAANTVTQVGRDLWFLSDDGVYAISQVLENALQAGDAPVTAPMESVMRRTNWASASQAQAIYHDKYYYLALPIDGSEFNNAILVYDLITQQWCGYWESPVIDVAAFLRISISGHRKLCFVSGDSIEGNTGVLYVLDDSYADERFGAEEDIETELETRGYMCGVGTDKRYLHAVAEIASWNGAGSIDVIRGGVNEESEVVTYSKDRTKYQLFAKRDYDTTNSNDDFLDPFRQDYSVEITSYPELAFNSAGTALNTISLLSTTIPITCDALTDGYILLTMVMNDPTANITAATFDGTAMTLIDNFVNVLDLRSLLYGLPIGNMAAGAHTVDVTATGFVDYFIGNILAYNNVHQTLSLGTPSHATANDNNPAVTVSSAPGDVVVSVVYAGGTITPASEQTTRWDSSGVAGWAMASESPGETSVTHSYSFTGPPGWVAAAVPLKALGRNTGINLSTGVVLDLHQYSSERVRIRQDGYFIQLRFSGTRGRSKLCSLSIEGHSNLMPMRSTL
jgi:hypothetical protein